MSDHPKPEDVSAHAQTAEGMGRAHDATVETRPGKLTSAQLVKAVAFISDHWGPSTPCPFHPGPTRWVIDPNIGQLPGYAKTSALSLSGITFPILVVTCQICGFIVPINAIKAGILEPDPPEVHDKAGDPPGSEGS